MPITDKEAASAYRLLAEYHQSTHEAASPGSKSAQAVTFTSRADALDPPKPTYADGLYRSAGGGHYWELRDGTWYGTSWAPGTYPADKVDWLIAIHGELVPVRVLADDEIAIKNPYPRFLSPTKASEILRSAGFSTSAELLDRIRDGFDALEKAKERRRYQPGGPVVVRWGSADHE